MNRVYGGDPVAARDELFTPFEHGFLVILREMLSKVGFEPVASRL